jgi:hypothetical protein
MVTRRRLLRWNLPLEPLRLTSSPRAFFVPFSKPERPDLRSHVCPLHSVSGQLSGANLRMISTYTKRSSKFFVLSTSKLQDLKLLRISTCTKEVGGLHVIRVVDRQKRFPRAKVIRQSQWRIRSFRALTKSTRLLPHKKDRGRG